MNRSRRRRTAIGIPELVIPSPLAGPADLETALRLEVKRSITEATADSYPAVYARLTDVGGYQHVEHAIIDYVLHNQVTPSAALAQLESTWGDV